MSQPPLSGSGRKPKNPWLFKPEGIHPDIRNLRAFLAFTARPLPWKQGEEQRFQKPPLDWRSGRKADYTDPATWQTLDDALRTMERYKGHGVGLSLGDGTVTASGRRLTAVDLDNCVHPRTGEIAPWAQRIVDDLNSRTEFSPSGRGLRIWCLTRSPFPGVKTKKGEVYNDKRFMSVTGHLFPGSPPGIEERDEEIAALRRRLRPPPSPDGGAPPPPPDRPSPLSSASDLTDAELMDRAFKHKGGAKLRELYEGGNAGHPSDSEADLAFCRKLAFLTGKDAARIKAIWRGSGRMRDKVKREDYVNRTVNKAVATQDDVYRPGVGAAGPGGGRKTRCKTQGGASEGNGRAGGPHTPTAPTPEQAPPPDPPAQLPEPDDDDDDDGDDPLVADPFPLDALPELLAALGREGGAAYHVAPAMLAVHLLAALGGLIGNSTVLMPKPTWRVRPTLWTLVVARSGSGKSQAFEAILDPLMDIEAGLNAEYRTAMRQRRGREDNSPMPVAKRLVVSDVTLERLATILGENPRGLLLAADELAQWFNSFTRYQNGQRASQAQQWLSLSDGKPLVYDRQTGSKPQVVVRNATVAVTGGIQPRTLRNALGNDAYETGLGPRLLLGMPNDDPPRYSRQELSDGVRAAYAQLCRDLFALPPLDDALNAWTPNRIKLTSEADQLWEEIFERWRKRMEVPDDAERSMCAKMQATPLRIALILHVVGAVLQGTNHLADLGPAALQSAGRMTDWFWSQAQHFACVRQETDAQAERRTLLEVIRRCERNAVTARELCLKCRTRFPTAEAARAALDALAADRLGKWKERPKRTKGGRPTVEFVLGTPT